MFLEKVIKKHGKTSKERAIYEICKLMHILPEVNPGMLPQLIRK